MRGAIILAIFLVAFGCASLEGKNCGPDKECLKDAFKKCEKAYGLWKGENGDIGVRINERKGDNCEVMVQILEKNLAITNRSMTCMVPLNGSNGEFSIYDKCEDELVGSFLFKK